MGAAIDAPSGASVSLAERDWTLPTGAIAQTVDRTNAINDVASQLASGRLNLVGIYLRAGQLVTNISFLSAGTPAGTPTHQWFSLWSAARAKLGVTSDDTTTAWAANAVKTLALASPYQVTASGLYYLGVLVTATSVPTLRNGPINATPAGLAPIICGVSTTGLTDPASAPSTAGAITAQTGQPYAYVA